MRRRPAALAAVAILALAFGWSAASARADGDPASDVLASQSLFMPADGGVPPVQQAQLSALLADSERSGYALRVALIATSSDLGSVTALWHQPASYARFLGQELSLVYRGTLLVVMPNGFGVYRAGGPVGRQLTALTGARQASLGATALAAVQHLAAAAGHPLALPSATVSSRSGSVDMTAWIAFALGLAVIALAWGASLRARPPKLPAWASDAER